MTKAKSKNDMSQWASNIDLEATRALIDELQTQMDGKNWDKLENSPTKYVANYRRICPKRPDWQNPWQIVPVHYLGANNRMTVCLKEAGLGDCPACQLRWELESGGDKGAAQGLRASIRTFLNVVKINQDGTLADDKVLLMGLNQLQFLGKRGVEYDPDEESELPLFYFFEKYGDLSHVETGRDLLIKAKEEKSGDYTMLDLKFQAEAPSPFPGTSEMLEEGLNNLPEVVPPLSATEMTALIEGRATGAMALNAGAVVQQVEGPADNTTPAPAAPANRFGGEEEEAETPQTEETPAEEPSDDPKASKAPPTTDPGAALKRLRDSQGG